MKKKTTKTKAADEPQVIETQIVPVEPSKPIELMGRANDVASVCKTIVETTAVAIQGRKYVKVEGWEAIAAAHGCHAGADTAVREFDEKGDHIGYKAKGYVRDKNGTIIATGEGFVGFDEKDRKGNPTWKNRAEYAGRAMAQTRAISRACRSVFAHVIVLIGGLETTPAEEIPHDYESDATQRVYPSGSGPEGVPAPRHDRTGKSTDFKKADHANIREATVKSLRSFLSEKQIPESFLMELCHKSSMADGDEENLTQLKDGTLERLNSEKYRLRVAELWQQKQSATETQTTEKNKRAPKAETPVSRKRPMLTGEGQEPEGVLAMAGVESWKNVVILSGTNKDIALGDLTQAQLRTYVSKWKPQQDADGTYPDEDIVMDAALSIAADEI